MATIPPLTIHIKGLTVLKSSPSIVNNTINHHCPPSSSMMPGCLVDLIERGCISMKNIHYLVLDEADCMLDVGFELRSATLFKAKICLMSMTARLSHSAILSHEIQILVCDFLKDYIFLSLGRVGSTSENITQKIEFVEDYDKRSVLLDIITSKFNGELTLIFVETKRMADMLSDT